MPRSDHKQNYLDEDKDEKTGNVGIDFQNFLATNGKLSCLGCILVLRL